MSPLSCLGCAAASVSLSSPLTTSALFLQLGLQQLLLPLSKALPIPPSLLQLQEARRICPPSPLTAPACPHRPCQALGEEQELRTVKGLRPFSTPLVSCDLADSEWRVIRKDTATLSITLCFSCLKPLSPYGYPFLLLTSLYCLLLTRMWSRSFAAH